MLTIYYSQPNNTISAPLTSKLFNNREQTGGLVFQLDLQSKIDLLYILTDLPLDPTNTDYFTTLLMEENLKNRYDLIRLVLMQYIADIWGNDLIFKYKSFIEPLSMNKVAILTATDDMNTMVRPFIIDNAMAAIAYESENYPVQQWNEFNTLNSPVLEFAVLLAYDIKTYSFRNKILLNNFT